MDAIENDGAVWLRATLHTVSTQRASQLEPQAASPADVALRPGFPDPGPRFLAAGDTRSRLLTAMAVAVGERGYAGTTVADVVRIARASRRTFYHHFEDRAECFLALGDELTDYALELVGAARTRPSAHWRERIDRALAAYLQTCAATPGLTRAYLLELFAVGERGLAHRRMAMRRWAAELLALVDDCRAEDPGLNDMSPETAMAIVGAVWEMSLLATEEGRPPDVREIREVAAGLIADVLTASGG
jgi:AcrR family transcriptional regulator